MAIRAIEAEELEALKTAVRYQRDFRAFLEHVASNALNSDSLLAATEFAALYMSEEIVAAIEAAQEAKLSTEEGVTYFIFLTTASRAEAQKRKGFFQRLKAKIEPRPGTVEHSHVAMTNYVLNDVLNGQLDQRKTGLFAQYYAAALAKAPL
jgi:hypothetical protein